MRVGLLAGGLMILLTAAVVLLTVGALVFTSSGGASSIDHEPVSIEEAYGLIDSGQVWRIYIRGRANTENWCYFLYSERNQTTCTWKVDGFNVHLFTDSMPTGVPILSHDGKSVGLTADEFSKLIEYVSGRIEVVDQRATPDR